MNAPNGHPPKSLRGWWQSPPRHGMARLLAPFEYRHVRLFGVVRLVGGGVAAVAGAICLAYSVDGWAAFFLVVGALNLAGGFWELTIARSTSNRT